MLPRLLSRPARIALAIRSYSAKPAEKWDLLAGVLVERLPIISKSLTAFETKYQTMLNELEFESSLKSNHEMRRENDIIYAERIKRGEAEVELDDAATKMTAQDKEDAWNEERKQFQLAPRTTDADHANDTRSLQRKLEETLYLVAEQKIGSVKHHLLPQGARNDGETMRETAERILTEQCGKQLDVTFFGNAPCGFYKYKYPQSGRGEAVGAKVFFYRAVLKNVAASGLSQDKPFEWLDRTEMLGKIQAKAYASSVSKFLL